MKEVRPKSKGAGPVMGKLLLVKDMHFKKVRRVSVCWELGMGADERCGITEQ